MNDNNIFKIKLLKDFFFVIHDRFNEILSQASIHDENNTLIYIKDSEYQQKGFSLNKEIVNALYDAFCDIAKLEKIKNRSNTPSCKQLINIIENLKCAYIEVTFTLNHHRKFIFDVSANFQTSNYTVTYVDNELPIGTLPTESNIAHIIDTFSHQLENYLSHS